MMLLILFGLSVKVLKDYQLPQGEHPYFTNIDHHAISNDGIAFPGSIDLYADEADSSKGIWPSQHGSFSINRAAASNAVMQFREFFVPVFGRQDTKKDYLINPVYDTPVSDGFTIADAYTSLTWKDVSVRMEDETPRYSFKVVFKTTDLYLLDSTFSPGTAYTDTAVFEDVTLKKGLDLKSILKKAKHVSNLSSHGILMRWTDRFPKSYLLTGFDDATAPKLYFFPSYDLFNSCKVYLEGRLLQPKLASAAEFNTADQFYVGLENSRKLMKIRQLREDERELAPEESHFLELNEIAYFPMKASVQAEQPMGKVEIRFLKNSYKQLGINEIREGFLFHDDIKSNSYTNIEAILQYYSVPAGSPLAYKLIQLGPKSEINNGKGRFGIKSANKALTWMFVIKDFSANPFDYSHLPYYLAMLMVLMLVLVLFFPGKNLLFIETPVLMIIYVLMVFRFLLLWRVATFPPLDNISTSEFNTLQNFDLFKVLGRTLPFPVSLFIVVAALGVVLIHRIVLMNKRKNAPSFIQLSDKREKANHNSELSKKLNTLLAIIRNPLLAHFMILVVAAVIQKLLNLDVLTRIASIFLPVCSYFYFTRQVIKSGEKYSYKEKRNKLSFFNFFSQFFRYWVETPVFFLSAFTFVYLAIFDKGFGVLFLFFLLFKNIIFSFHRPPAGSRQNSRRSIKERLFSFSNYWVYGLICLPIYFIAIGDKRSVSYLLENKLVILILATIFCIVGILFLIDKKIWRNIALVVTGLILLALLMPFTKEKVEGFLDNKISNVKYRASILFEPVENLLFNHQYNSSNEQKIIETAQNQWYINSYLNAGKDESILSDDRKIRLREHFNKGVDYTTQTRDVVLPRYVIAEFGGLTMLLLLMLFALPLLIYFLTYRLTDGGRFHFGSYAGAMALILLLTLALFVWLTSTNRFAFFGQDFPFLSLTSRVSCLLPMFLFGVLLVNEPIIERTNRESKNGKPYRWGLFILLLGVVIVFSGKSNLLNEQNFRIDFTKVENRVEQINDVLNEVQAEAKESIHLSEADFGAHPDKFVNNVKHLLERMYSDKRFTAIYTDATVYEKSILDTLRVNPKIGFNIRSPLHFKYDAGEGRLHMDFNKYWHLELPAYNIKEVWKGDIVEETFSKGVANNEPIMDQPVHKAQIIEIPASYLLPGEKPIGLLRYDSDPGGAKQLCYVLNKKTKELIAYKPANAVANLGEDNIVFFTDEKDGLTGNWVMHAHNRHYFAYNFLINGRQKHIYPLGNQFFWIRHWAQANKYFNESKKDYQSKSTVTLDFELNRRVNSFLQANLKQYNSKLPELTFSALAADGNGRIRLMADYAAQRENLDPNDERKISLKESEQYFNIDAHAERLQWANLNLLRMELGPGSSIKPLVAAGIASQLNAGWERLMYHPGEVGVNRNKPAITHYAGLKLGGKGWPLESGNLQTNFIDYLRTSNNLYHSLLVFLGSYQKENFKKDGNFSVNNLIGKKDYGNGILKFPVLSTGGEPSYLPAMEGWPLTYQNLPAGAHKTYFGSTTSLLANGMNLNFDLYVEPNNRYGGVESKYRFSNLLPDSIMNKRTWSFPEASYFFQEKRTSKELLENFNKGLRFPTLGGDPFVLTPLKMLEMYGKLASLNPLYSVGIDQPGTDSAEWNYDSETWKSQSNYESFLADNVYKGMERVMTDGTAARLAGTQHYRGFYIYAKTGTIGNSDNKNSKRLALIITKNPMKPGNMKGQRFYVVYFTIGNAFGSDDDKGDKSWFWPVYRKVLDDLISSDSFNAYMN